MSNVISQTLALQLLPGFGPSSYWKAVEHFGSLHAIIESSHNSPDDLKGFMSSEALDVWRQYIRSPTTSALQAAVKKEIQAADQHEIQLLSASCKDYPPLLKEIKRPPPILYVKGSLEVLHLPQIAIVGSRKPTPAGQSIALTMASELSRAGFVITSGLALGIDSCAHKGSLNANGKTLAVLGSGLLKVYPRRNVALAQQILDSGGTIVSEFPLYADALASHFPRRNRIVSGLSCGTLVVEAALKSGSLITAKCALQQNREVFAVPGSILSEVSRGCNAMIKSGAKLVESSADILGELYGVLGFFRSRADHTASNAFSHRHRHQQQAKAQAYPEPESESSREPKLSEVAESVFACIGYENITLAEIASKLHSRVENVTDALLELELIEVIENTGLGYIRK